MKRDWRRRSASGGHGVDRQPTDFGGRGGHREALRTGSRVFHRTGVGVPSAATGSFTISSVRRDKLHRRVCVFVSVRGHGTRVMCVVMSFTRRLERERKFRAVKSGLERRGGEGKFHKFEYLVQGDSCGNWRAFCGLGQRGTG